MGLFDAFTQLDENQNQGLLAAAAQMLMQSGPSRTPTSLGQIAGGGLMAYQDTTDLSKRRQLQEQEAAQMAQMRQQDMAAQAAAAQKQAAIDDAYRQAGDDPQKLVAGLQQASPQDAWKVRASLAPKPVEYDTTPRVGVDANGKAIQYIMGKDGSMKVIDGIAPRDKPENINGMWVNPYNQREGSVAPQDVNQPFLMGADGKPVANDAYQRYQISKARAGASNVSVNTATKPFLTEIGKGAGEAVNAAHQGAIAASKTLQNVEQIRQGLGNAIIGPGANARVTLAQIGQTLGVTGKNTAEQLANTRMVIQGLARQELAGAEQMKGQGQITESERSIIRRAESGMIGDFTAGELNTLLNVLDRTARHRIGVHQSNMQRLQKDPNAAGIVDYMRVDVPAAAAPSQPASGKARKFNPATGRIE